MNPQRPNPMDIPEELERRARALRLVDRAQRIAAMLDRWEAEDVGDEPEWDVDQLERLALRPHAS